MILPDEIVDDHSRQIFLIVPEPDMHYLIHAHYVERMAEFARRTGVEFIAIVGAQGVDMERWSDWTRPDFPVYTADATALKQLVRGIEALCIPTAALYNGNARYSRCHRRCPTAYRP